MDLRELLGDTPAGARQRLADNLRGRRLQRNITREELSASSGVPHETLKKFEQTGRISLESFLKLANALGAMDAVVAATEPPEEHFGSMDELIAANRAQAPRRRQRSRRRRGQGP